MKKIAAIVALFLLVVGLLLTSATATNPGKGASNNQGCAHASATAKAHASSTSVIHADTPVSVGNTTVFVCP
jgi:hypothetical protein